MELSPGGEKRFLQATERHFILTPTLLTFFKYRITEPSSRNRAKEEEKTLHMEDLAQGCTHSTPRVPAVTYIPHRAWGEEGRDDGLQGLSSPQRKEVPEGPEGTETGCILSSGWGDLTRSKAHTPAHSVASVPTADPNSHGPQRSHPPWTHPCWPWQCQAG